MAHERSQAPIQDQLVCAVVVTLQPDLQVTQRLDALIRQVPYAIVVDNASSDSLVALLRSWTRSHNADLLTNEQNLGVASALNQGFRLALAKGYAFVLALDQDSHVRPGMVDAELAVYQAHSGVMRTAIIAPMIEDPDNGIKARYLRSRGKFFFERVDCAGNVIDDVSSVISSGGLFNLAAYREIGPFRDDYFVDYVDTEYCLRARRHGYRISVACQAGLYHKWGDIRRIQVGPLEIRPTFHSPQRWYFISRNRIDIIRTHGLMYPHFVVYDLLLAIWWIVRMLIFEDFRFAKAKCFLRGTVDGLLGRMGSRPPVF
jgi:rhamnosyltransferase